VYELFPCLDAKKEFILTMFKGFWVHRVDRIVIWELFWHKLNPIGSGHRPLAVFRNCSNGLTGSSIKDRVFLNNLNDCRFLKKDCAPWNQLTCNLRQNILQLWWCPFWTATRRKSDQIFFYLCTVHFDIYEVHTPKNVLFIKSDKVLKFTLKITFTCPYMLWSTTITCRGKSKWLLCKF